MIAAFDGDADAAVRAARSAVGGLAGATWGPTGPLVIRTAIHAGSATERDGDYFGPPVNRVARILGVTHAGQILVSDTARALMRTMQGRDLGSHQLRDLGDAIRLWQLDNGDHPALATLKAALHNLPRQASEFIGRERDIREVLDLIGRHRLVTVTGVGGCGKTRLALEASAALPTQFPGGVWFVDLSAVTDDSGVAMRAVEAIGLSLAGGEAHPSIKPEAALTEYLGRRPSLVVLDNCEHVIDASAELADLLLSSTAETRILTTSREPLSVDGERVWRIPSLTVDAPALFIERARGADSGFAPAPPDLPVIAEICERLDGIPLAIELAASRTTALSLTELRDRLDDRFALLSGGRRVRRQRQQTLQAMMDWSWALLDPDQQRMLAELSVFPGTVGIDGAEAVCTPPDHATVIDRLAELVQRSLLVAERGDTTRYRLLVTVRMYGADRLAESKAAAATRDRLAAWVWSFASIAAAEQPRRGSVFDDWWRMVARETTTVTAALDWWADRADTAAEIEVAAITMSFSLLRDDGAAAIARLRRVLDGTPVSGLSDRARLMACAALSALVRFHGEFELLAAAAGKARQLIASGVASAANSYTGILTANAFISPFFMSFQTLDVSAALAQADEAGRWAGQDLARLVGTMPMRIMAHAFHGQSDDALARYEEWEQIRGQLAMNSIWLDHIAHVTGATSLSLAATIARRRIDTAPRSQPR